MPLPALLLAAALAAPAQATVVRGAGDITPAVKRFRALERPVQEITWDAVPAANAAPNALPPRFFDARSGARARGAVLSTPGDHVAVSADDPLRFGDVNAGYTSEFTTFSAPRLFSPIGSNVVNLTFHRIGTSTRGLVHGFGAVYTDVDRKENTAFRFYDARNRLLGSFDVPVSKDGLSFLGVRFARRVVARVRIVYGSGPLGPDDGNGYDAAVMDNFIYDTPG
jgi:hypothetical protein